MNMQPQSIFIPVMSLIAMMAIGLSNFDLKADDISESVSAISEDEPVMNFLSATPVDGETLPNLPAGYVIKVAPSNFKDYPQMYVEYEIESLNQETSEWDVIKSYVWMNRNEAEECYTAQIPRTIKLYEGASYRIKVSSWENENLTHGSMELKKEKILGVGYIAFKGSTPPYQMSPYSFVGISPSASLDRFNPVLPEDCEFLTVEFDGPVTLGTSKETGIVQGMGAGNKSFLAIQPADESEVINNIEYAKKWNLVFPKGYVKSQINPITITLKAFDAAGRCVKGDLGIEDNSYTLFEFNVPRQYGELSYNFGSNPISSVNYVLASFSTGINYSYMYHYSDAYIMKDDAKVATVNNVVLVYESTSMSARAKVARLMLDTTLVDPGEYTLCIPEGYFTLGTEYTVYYQRSQEIPFEIYSELTGVNPVDITTQPVADRFVVFNMYGMKILDTPNPEDLKSLKGLYIVNGVKTLLK